jgi:Mce-associated membrane protein
MTLTADTADTAADTAVDETDATADEGSDEPTTAERRRPRWGRILTYGVLPAVVVILSLTAGFAKWAEWRVDDQRTARVESVQAASQIAVAMLSYQPDTVEKDLAAVQDRLTGPFLDSYRSLVHDVVIPGSHQKKIGAIATVAAAASVSVTEDHAVALLFINQAATVGNDAPISTASSVRVTLDRVNGRWLVSGFDPI